MAIVADVLALKSPRVHTVPPGMTVLEATRVMNRHKIGALIVTTGPRAPEDQPDCDRVVGIFTERDVLTRVVAQQCDVCGTLVSDVMTHDVAFCRPDDDLEAIGAMMRERRIRHLPVCDGEHRLRGIISIGDLNAWHAQGQEVTITYLNEYIYGRV